MTQLQIENLFTFYFLYNGCDRKCDLTKQSPDYLMEKWEKLIGIHGNKIKYPELLESELFQEWGKIWLKGNQNIIPENIMMFVIKSHPRENNGKYCKFLKLCNLFQTYIGKTIDITQEEYLHIHPNLVDTVQKICSNYISKEDLREIIINNMLS